MSEALAIVDTLLESDELDPKDFALSIRRYDKSTDKFHNQDGSLSNYAFACGYVQEVEIMGVKLQLWKEGLWQVRAHDHHAGRRLFWDSFEKRGDAVRRYNQELRRLQAQQKTGLRENDEEDPKEFLERNTVPVYYSIVFLQNDEDQLLLLKMRGEQEVLEVLADVYDRLDEGGEHESSLEPNRGDEDDYYEADYNGHHYILSYNTGLGYIALDRVEHEFPDEERNLWAT